MCFKNLVPSNSNSAFVNFVCNRQAKYIPTSFQKFNGHIFRQPVADMAGSAKCSWKQSCLLFTTVCSNIMLSLKKHRNRASDILRYPLVFNYFSLTAHAKHFHSSKFCFSVKHDRNKQRDTDIWHLQKNLFLFYSSNGIVTRLMGWITDELQFKSQQNQEIFLFSTTSWPGGGKATKGWSWPLTFI
jgi:hypothetical protein